MTESRLGYLDAAVELYQKNYVAFAPEWSAAWYASMAGELPFNAGWSDLDEIDEDSPTTQVFAYTSQYNTRMAYDSEEFQINTDVQYLWAQVLPELLMAASDEEFDQLFADFIRQRDEMGYDKVLAEQTRQMIENKKKLGIS